MTLASQFRPVRLVCGQDERRQVINAALADQPWRERFWSRVDKTGECWLWTASRDRHGYGQVRTPQRSGRRLMLGAHRVAYELTVGPITEGLDLDHLCRVPACVNPAHLEPVTRRENSLRGVAPGIRVFVEGVCPRGHELVPSNLYVSPKGRRMCRACIAIRRGLRRDRERARRVNDDPTVTR